MKATFDDMVEVLVLKLAAYQCGIVGKDGKLLEGELND